MHYQQYSPKENLKDLVQFFWTFEADVDECIPYAHLATASISPKLAFQYEGSMEIQGGNYLSGGSFRSGFQGQGCQSYQIIAKRQVGIFGVYFFPQAIPLLFSVPAEALTDQHVEISAVLGKTGKALEEIILSAQSTLERITLITLFLEKQRAKGPTPEASSLWLLRHILARQGMVEITSLVATQCVSQRQLERKFKALTGFSPKLFSRIVRFEHSISTCLQTNLSLTQIAYACGYYDQSHFIRDFREFSGLHPKAYFREDLSLFAP